MHIAARSIDRSLSRLSGGGQWCQFKLLDQLSLSRLSGGGQLSPEYLAQLRSLSRLSGGGRF